MRQASYACGKTARQKNLTAINAVEAVGLDGVEEMAEYLNEMCDEESEKNVSDDEKEKGEDDSGGTRGATAVCGTFVPLPCAWKASRRSVA